MPRSIALKIVACALGVALVAVLFYFWAPTKRMNTYDTSQIQQQALTEGAARPIVSEPANATGFDVPNPLGWADRAERSMDEALRAGQQLCADDEGTLYVAPRC
jgi:hypothetical protein